MNNSLLVVIIILTIIFSCGSPDVQLSRTDLRLADSLFLVNRNEWNEKLKDSCDIVKERMFDYWVDSIKNERLSEIEIMLDRREKI